MFSKSLIQFSVDGRGCVPSLLLAAATAKSLQSCRLLAAPWTETHHAPPSMDFLGKSTEMGCHCLLRYALYSQ